MCLRCINVDTPGNRRFPCWVVPQKSGEMYTPRTIAGVVFVAAFLCGAILGSKSFSKSREIERK